jgi:hypothetical protein
VQQIFKDGGGGELRLKVSFVHCEGSSPLLPTYSKSGIERAEQITRDLAQESRLLAGNEL